MAFVPEKKPCGTDTLYMLGAIAEAFPSAYPIIFHTGQGQYLQMGTYVILHSKEHQPVKLYQEMNALRKRHANGFPRNIVCPYQTFYLEANVIGDSHAKELLVPDVLTLALYLVRLALKLHDMCIN